MIKKQKLLKGTKIKQQARWLPFMLPYAVTLISLVFVLLISNIISIVQITKLNREISTAKAQLVDREEVRQIVNAHKPTKAEIKQMVQNVLGDNYTNTVQLQQSIALLEREIARIQAKLDVKSSIKEIEIKETARPKAIRLPKITIEKKEEEPVSRGTTLSF
ncbi:MAG: hypothetical protein JXD21_08690 [Candidatus Omnitrophica bacterium]|nr:hypothetical protein [Candidatus Omnitrophota bacterium]